jgi:signal transduction histidine kinase
MLDRLQSAFERERRFSADVAHELRTPLTALQGRIGVTLSQPRRPEEYSGTLEEMATQVDRLIQLSNDLLFIARLDQGQLTPHMEKIDLTDFLDALVDQIQPLAEAKAISLHQEVPSGQTLWGDFSLLSRLFLNLLDNAVKYTPTAGEISLRAASNPDWVQVDIRDTGKGIAAEYLPHLFERFYRVESDRSRSESGDLKGGAGLGLAIAYEIASLHGGNLSAESVVGEGTTFTLRLPFSAGSPPEPDS